jgi:CHAD domain-containing protein
MSKAVKGRIAPLDPEWTAHRAFAHIAQACVDHLVANEACALEGRDAEGVHQMRVAARRLRSALSLFPKCAEAGLGRELKWFAGELGDARDWDVLIDETLACLPDRESLAGPLERAAAARGDAYDAARAVVQSLRYAALVLQLRSARWHDDPTPIRAHAEAALRRRRKKVRKLGKRLPELSDAELHRLRIRIKRLRYAAWFFKSLIPADELLRCLREWQDVLGRLQDFAVTPGFLRRLGSEELLERVAAWQAAQDVRLRARLPELWARLEAIA